jgi:hypothetical protein
MSKKKYLAPLAAAAVVAGAGLAVAQIPVAHSAVNYFDATKVVSGSGTVYCPFGYRVTGGGSVPKSDYFGSTTSDEYDVTSSYPYSTTSWRVTGVHIHGSYSSTRGWAYTQSTWYPSVKAVCTG